jgi:cytochrome c556
LSINTVEMPAVQQVVSNSTQIAASVERFAAVAEKLPNQVSTEREEILKALQSQEKDAASLVTAGTQMSDSLNTTLTTFDALMKRFGVGETNNAGPPATNSRPFNIQDYTATAAQLAVTAQQLTELLVTLDQTLGSTNLAKLSAQLGPVVQQAQTGGKQIVDYAFWKSILLVAIVLVAMLIYRFLGARLTRATNSKSNSP